MYECVEVHPCMLTYMYIHTYIHTYIRIYIHTYVYTYVSKTRSKHSGEDVIYVMGGLIRTQHVYTYTHTHTHTRDLGHPTGNGEFGRRGTSKRWTL